MIGVKAVSKGHDSIEATVCGLAAALVGSSVSWATAYLDLVSASICPGAILDRFIALVARIIANPTTTDAARTDSPRLATSIWLWTALVGGAGFGVGFFGPMFLMPSNNLAPLMGLLVTGPLAAMLGMLFGLAIAIRDMKREQLREATGWLIFNWILLCAFYYFTLNRFSGTEWAILGMLANIGLGAALLSHAVRSLEAGLRAVGIGGVLMLGAAAILAMSIFPPATLPWWGPVNARSIGEVPAFVFVLDPRLDASRHMPELAVDADQWRLQLAATLLVIAVSCGLISRVARR